GAFLSGWSLRTDAMLIFGGVVTALPLIGFAYGVRRIPLSLVGILQYIAPSLQLLLGVWFFHEPFDQGRAMGFAAIWVGLLLFVGDSVLRSRQPVAAR
ncbi:EamA family transporter RarD, partial [Xanthomonas oryzae pv. oryzae]